MLSLGPLSKNLEGMKRLVVACLGFAELLDILRKSTVEPRKAACVEEILEEA